MSTYKVKSGDTLSSLYKKLGYKTWQDLYNANKQVIGNNPNLIYAGQVYNYAGSGGSSSTTGAPSTGIGTTIAAAVEDPTRENFIKKYGREEDYIDAEGNLVQGLRPDEMFMAAGEERVNPEQMRIASQQMKNMDWQRAIGGGGGRVSGSTLLARQNAMNQLERQRKEAVNEYVQSQNQLYNTWYNTEMANYMKSKAPSAYQMNKFGVEMPTFTSPTGATPTSYGYTPAVDFTKTFNLGGYSRPAVMYNQPTPVYS